MRTQFRVLTFVVSLLHLLTATGTGASAEERTSNAGAYVDGGNATAAASDQIEVKPTGWGPSSEASNCDWQVFTEDDTAVGVFDSDGQRLHSETGRWYQKVCDGQPVPVGDSFVVPESTTEVQPQTLAAEAVRSVDIAPPPLLTSPAVDEVLYTGLPTWLWLDEGWWRAYRATARAGSVTSAVTATPVRARWSAGDGGHAVCSGPGLEWRPGMAEDASECRYTYGRSSAGEADGRFTLSVTVEFEVSWSSNLGEGGRLPGITRSASWEVRVGEIQAIETG